MLFLAFRFITLLLHHFEKAFLPRLFPEAIGGEYHLTRVCLSNKGFTNPIPQK